MESKIKVIISRRYDFSATHRLFNPSLSEDENADLYNECANPLGHGHNFELWVSFEVSTCVIQQEELPLDTVDELVNRAVIQKVDHKHLNHDVDFLREVIPSVENMIVLFWNQIACVIPGSLKLNKLKLIETRNNSVEYYGPAPQG